MNAIVLALLLALGPTRWEVTVTNDAGKVTETYTAVTKPAEHGSRLVFEIEVPRPAFGTGSKRREVSVPSVRATVREIKEKAQPFESK